MKRVGHLIALLVFALASVPVSAQQNGIGAVGVAPAANVISAKIFTVVSPDPTVPTQSSIAEIVDGIRYSVTTRARVTNSSWSLQVFNQSVDNAFRDTRNDGVVHFAATDNDGQSAIAYPASSIYVAAVGAIDSFGLLAPFSNYGDDIDFVGPGVNIFTTDRTGSDGYNSGPNPDYVINADLNGIDGASFACPHAAGVAALILSRNRTLTPQQVVQRMRQTAVDINPQLYGFGFDEYTGARLINARAALNATLPIRRTDLNADGLVNSVDLTMLLGAWGPCPVPPSLCDADIDGDELVNSVDLTMLLGTWT